MSEMSLKGYRELLTAFQEAGYAFCKYEEVDASLAKKRPFVIARHDIDISLRPALEFARLEYELGIQATYFVLFRSPFYNVLSRQNVEIMQQIHDYGHILAAHVDLAAYDNDCVEGFKEIDLLSKFYPYVDTNLVSLHSSYDLQYIPINTFRELDNVYGSAVRGDVAYISDSTGRWRYGYPLDSDAFKEGKPIQLLTHPIWWVQEGETAAKKLENWLHADYVNNLDILKEFLPKLFRLAE